MKCGFCGYEFDPSDAQSSCGACPMAGGCHLVRCPRCGYEMPPEARLIRWLRTVRARLTQHQQGAARHRDRTVDR
jgi:tRNA(Ile2) C34 agmatinyltransferase TiaS